MVTPAGIWRHVEANKGSVGFFSTVWYRCLSMSFFFVLELYLYLIYGISYVNNLLRLRLVPSAS